MNQLDVEIRKTDRHKQWEKVTLRSKTSNTCTITNDRNHCTLRNETARTKSSNDDDYKQIHYNKQWQVTLITVHLGEVSSKNKNIMIDVLGL